MVKPDVANTVENYLISLASQSKIKPPVTDDQLKQILLSIQHPLLLEFSYNHHRVNILHKQALSLIRSPYNP